MDRDNSDGVSHHELVTFVRARLGLNLDQSSEVKALITKVVSKRDGNELQKKIITRRKIQKKTIKFDTKSDICMKFYFSHRQNFDFVLGAISGIFCTS